MSVREIQTTLKKLGSKRRAKFLQGFFKTGPGEYAEDDVFLGITVPVLRRLARQYPHTPLGQVERLLKSPIHEQRLLALLVLGRRYQAAYDSVPETTYE